MELVGLTLLVIAAVVLTAVTAKRQRRAWEQLARARGLALVGPPHRPAIEGWYHGRSTRVSFESRGDESNYTVWRVAVGERVPSGLLVRKGDVLETLDEPVGSGDIDVGDSILDQTLSVQGQDVARIIRLMRIPEVGAAMLAAITTEPKLEIGQLLTLEERSFAEPRRFDQVLHMLGGLAQVIETGCRQLEREDRAASG